MSTLTAFLVAFFASFGAPVHQCDGALVWGSASCAADRMASPPPPQTEIVLDKSTPRQISNGL